jgi:hypothetical protein
VLDHYNSHYNNGTYRAFRTALESLSKANPTYGGEAFEHRLTNLLIDASFERSQAARYQGAERSLMQSIRPLSPDLVTLALQHLANFGEVPATPAETRDDQVLDQITAAQHLAEAATRDAADLQSWQGRMAFAWTSAAAYLLQATAAILVDTHYDSYPLEKLDRFLIYFRNGVSEARSARFSLSTAFLNWIMQCPRVRD